MWTMVVWETQVLGMPAPSTWDGSQGFQDPLLTMASLPTSLRAKLSHLKIGLRSTTGHQRRQPSSGWYGPPAAHISLPHPQGPQQHLPQRVGLEALGRRGLRVHPKCRVRTGAMGEGQAEPRQHGSLEPVRCR